ncbi:sensor histidine kinase [Vibrio penaeicida]|uniref:histidine kinase n=1 Tax=Vibrio penaeicida TaxID=104609 RepID=A0AAV5NYZ5_9VIBR|nr:ATP-binding protein [Vibrio penaeicida]RTZ20599.1 PAS domain S-box protein [Vibrio penaeicida]GLQ75790.1 sensor histidine kinase [Vibrio penaeicida]
MSSGVPNNNSDTSSASKSDGIISTLKTMNRHSFAVRLLIYIVLCTSVLAVTITAVQLYWDYKKEVQLLQDSISSLEQSLTSSISNSLWNLDEEQMLIQANGILNVSSVEYVGIFSFHNGTLNSVVEIGEQSPLNELSHLYDLVHKEEKIGGLRIEASYELIYGKLWEKSIVILQTQLVKIFLVAMCVLYVVYHVVIKHINRISSFVQGHKLDSNESGDLLSLDRSNHQDELDTLVESINALYHRIDSELGKRKKMNNQLEYERDFTRVIIQSSPSLICSLNDQFEIQLVNSEVEALLGVEERDLIGENWFGYFVNEDVERESEQELIENIPEFDLVFTMRDQEGKQRFLQWRVVENKEQKRVMCFGIDVTDLTNAENQLISLNRELEQKVKDRTHSLEEANHELSDTLSKLEETQESLIEAEKMASLGSLVGGVAHEINTPLGISVTATSFIDEKVNVLQTGFETGKLSKKQFSGAIESLKESAQILTANLSRAEQLVSSFKQVAVDQSSESVYPFNVKENLEKVLLSLSHELKVANVSVEVDCPDNIHIESYPSCYIQIYTNLIANSIRHGFDEWSGDKNIFIHVSTNEENLIICYKDTGQGVDEQILKRIFEPFVTTKRGKGGSGLGANIIYNIVNQLLKGKIECSSELGHGAEFVITVPLQLDLQDKQESA